MEFLKQLEELVVPDFPAPPPKNIFDITRTRNKEVINSRVLSYFLNPNEEHGFKRLFFDALLELILEKAAQHKPAIDVTKFNGEFVITEEESSYNEIKKINESELICC